MAGHAAFLIMLCKDISAWWEKKAACLPQDGLSNCYNLCIVIDQKGGKLLQCLDEHVAKR